LFVVDTDAARSPTPEGNDEIWETRNIFTYLARYAFWGSLIKNLRNIVTRFNHDIVGSTLWLRCKSCFRKGKW